MITRDSLGIICQLQVDGTTLDCGDSACRTGIMTLCGSFQDSHNLEYFEIKQQHGPGLPFVGEGILVRHPTQAPWKSPKNFTRDQLIPFVAGAHEAGYIELVQRVWRAHAARWFRCQNSEYDVPGSGKQWPDGPDLLTPDHIWYLAVCAQSNWRFPLALIGAPWLLLSLLYNRFTTQEQNQLVCMCMVLKWNKLYRLLTPNYKQRIMQYWSSWRNQSEIGGALVTKLEQ